MHPGAIPTPLARHLTAEDIDEMLVAGPDGERLMPEFKTPEQGAATAVWAVTADLPDDRGGAYCEDCDVAGWAGEGRTSTGVKAWARDPDEAARLWEWSATLTGVDAFGA